MKSPFQRIRRGVLYLVLIFLCSVFGYLQVFPKDNVLDAIHWIVITVSTVGFSERSDLPPWTKVYVILVVVFGITAAAYTIGGALQLMTEGEIERALGHRRMSREINKLQGHVIICGCGRTGQILNEELSRQNVPFMVIDSDEVSITEAETAGCLVILGDATDENVLKAAHIDTAKTLICALGDDAVNVFLTLTARTLNPSLRIIARGEHPKTKDKLLHAGANQVIMPAVIGAQRIVNMVTRPLAAELIDRVTDHTVLDVGIEELTIGATSPLVGQTVQAADAHRRHDLLVVAIRNADGKMAFNPHAEYEFSENDTLMLIGKHEDIQGFRSRFQL